MMHRIQVSLDKELLEAMQSNFEAQKLGSEAFIRHALRFYLRVGEKAKTRQQYKTGYGENDLTDLALEMKDWEDEQVWPET